MLFPSCFGVKFLVFMVTLNFLGFFFCANPICCYQQPLGAWRRTTCSLSRQPIKSLPILSTQRSSSSIHYQSASPSSVFPSPLLRAILLFQKQWRLRWLITNVLNYSLCARIAALLRHLSGAETNSAPSFATPVACSSNYMADPVR